MTATTIPTNNQISPPSALTRVLRACWRVPRRLGVLCWAIAVALINLAEG